MVPVYQNCHVVCLPSYHEGVSKALLEAASCERPLVGTDIPGLREIVRPGINGYMAPVKDARALADALRPLLQSAELRLQMGRRSREIVLAEFSIERIVDENLALYRELLSA
jgi:glycosyltransferase involved in cell wall biosynthesis